MSKEITEGDCIEVMKDMEAGSIDCMVTDRALYRRARRNRRSMEIT